MSYIWSIGVLYWMRSKTFETVNLGEMVQQSLDMRRHGRSLGHVGASGVEASLVRVVLNTHLFPLGSHEAVAASDGVRGTNLLSGGPVIIGKARSY